MKLIIGIFYFSIVTISCKKQEGQDTSSFNSIKPNKIKTEISFKSDQIYFVLPANTDGTGLLPPPISFSKEESKKIFDEGKKSCQDNCFTPFGQQLGSSDNIIAWSNCKSTCILPKFGFFNHDINTLELKNDTANNDDQLKKSKQIYTGVIYQCVEYARRWWIKNYNITFGSIDSANEIIYLTEATNIQTNESIALARSVNGTALIPPKRGDLLVYYPLRTNPNWRHGHVAIIVDVDLIKEKVYVVEQNYENIAWQNPNKYARVLNLKKQNNKYFIEDVATLATTSIGKISGWIYPQQKIK